jgi:hypothetical protein
MKVSDLNVLGSCQTISRDATSSKRRIAFSSEDMLELQELLVHLVDVQRNSEGEDSDSLSDFQDNLIVLEFWYIESMCDKYQGW